jgi:hypothetical protein
MKNDLFVTYHKSIAYDLNWSLFFKRKTNISLKDIQFENMIKIRHQYLWNLYNLIL